MSSHDLTVIIIISLLIVLLPAVGLYKMFQKAGIPAWKAFVPFLNTWEMVRVTGIRKHWFFWQFIPVVGWFISLWILVEFVKLFNKFRFLQHAATVLVGFAYLPMIGFDEKEKYYGPEIVKKHKKSAAREWIDAGVFAVVAATLIRTFVFEAYTIPTGSMEKTLLVNDFLFVSKLSYGPRIPNTPLAVPFVHHTLPITNSKSYSELIHIPYTRWFASPVKRNDVVVFNFPAGDTVINLEEYQSRYPYYDVAWDKGGQNMDAGRQIILSNPEDFPLIVRPVDKKENYIKRCVAIAGDTLQIIDGVLYVNGEKAFLPPKMQLLYEVTVKVPQLDYDVLKEEYDFAKADDSEIMPMGGNRYAMLLTNEAKDKMIKNGLIDSVKVSKQNPDSKIFPRDGKHHWQVDDFGPLWVPKKGATLTITDDNFAMYERAIRVYEHNELELRNGKYYINGQETNKYTFKMDYFWMMGDNRHYSQDSRFWGFVPEDHVVGEAWLIWMSWDKGVRWNRMFSSIH
ncbi:S26 family signal peptidase [Paraflavitalea sp. CAU 1676]|uniref:S26 family signal peptidase n=1 Tax=Paraflavitalea sp. CAU 1676 TaxID=3032598 RepID=UPI0023DAA110|nr:S26 family signal peptidase [Paraflavitalea sp. CAU 1676]MDF2187843.1 S26 family signal peptidase [Paraflavitalea sp. CAU 1676]